ncbi:hypothetical protein BN1708_011344, partial [Verticillium longisporum]
MARTRAKLVLGFGPIAAISVIHKAPVVFTVQHHPVAASLVIIALSIIFVVEAVIDAEEQVLAALGLWWDWRCRVVVHFPAVVAFTFVAVWHLEACIVQLALSPWCACQDHRWLTSIILKGD